MYIYECDVFVACGNEKLVKLALSGEIFSQNPGIILETVEILCKI